MAKVLGYEWEAIQAMQQKKGSLSHAIPSTKPGEDYGADPIGDGTFKMVPSGDIVSFEERNKRLSRFA